VLPVQGISLKTPALNSKSDRKVLLAYGKLQKVDRVKMKVGLNLLRRV